MKQDNPVAVARRLRLRQATDELTSLRLQLATAMSLAESGFGEPAAIERLAQRVKSQTALVRALTDRERAA